MNPHVRREHSRIHSFAPCTGMTLAELRAVLESADRRVGAARNLVGLEVDVDGFRYVVWDARVEVVDGHLVCLFDADRLPPRD